MTPFQKAVKRAAKLRLALCGPAGSGKTYSLLALATKLRGPIAYVDTEHGSASKYADLFSFGVSEPDTFDPRPDRGHRRRGLALLRSDGEEKVQQPARERDGVRRGRASPED